MRAYVIGFLILLACVALQDAWPPWLRIAAEPPAFVVAAVACLGLVRGPVDGCLAGLVGAELLAGAQGLPMGGLFLGLMTVGTLSGFLRGTLFAERPLVAVLITTVGVLATNLLRIVFAPPGEFVVWMRDTFVSALYTVLAAYPIFWLARLTRSPDTAL